MTETQVDVGTRTRSHEWTDPAVSLAHLGSATGIELLQRIARGELPPPPIMSTIGFDDVAEFEEGRARFYLTPAEHHYNPIGSVHGGVIATLLDSATGCAVQSVLRADEGYTSLDLSVKYTRMVTTATGRVTAEGVVLQRGSRTALAEARLTDARGKLLAHATSSCLIFPIPAR